MPVSDENLSDETLGDVLGEVLGYSSSTSEFYSIYILTCYFLFEANSFPQLSLVLLLKHMTGIF